MTISESFTPSPEDDENNEQSNKIRCLVEQGFTPSLARNVILSKSTTTTINDGVVVQQQQPPLTIWICDNSSSMLLQDGKQLVETSTQSDVQLVSCTRWEELQETVRYHAQFAALIQAPTKFILLNSSPTTTGGIIASSSLQQQQQQQEWSIAERGFEWINTDLDELLQSFTTLQPFGVTPLTYQLQRIYDSIIQPSTLVNHPQKIIVIVATDGKPTDSHGYTSTIVNDEFELMVRQLSSIGVWIVIRLCTNDDSIVNYYQQLDDELEVSIDVVDDYIEEAQEIYHYNPWLTYSLCLHRCREMGMSYHSFYRWLDWLDERSLTRTEIVTVVQQLLGMIKNDDNDNDDNNNNNDDEHLQLSNITLLAFLDEIDDDEWNQFCDIIEREQQQKMLSHGRGGGGEGGSNSSGLANAYHPWNPIQRKPTPWIDMYQLRRHTGKKKKIKSSWRTIWNNQWSSPSSSSSSWGSWIIIILSVVVLFIAIVYHRY